MENDYEIVCAKIEEEKEYLNTVSQEIWSKPELAFQEVHAHALLSDALEKFGFKVERHYVLETAFKAEYQSKEAPGKNLGPTVAILLEYDALPGIGHACGHNLISEAGLAAAIAAKTVMNRNPALLGKLVVMGTPAEERGGGKIRLLEKDAFKDIDVAIMAHPGRLNYSCPKLSYSMKGSIQYIGKESHAAYAPWEGLNALDAAVVCYNNISVLRQQIRPENRILVNITEGGMATNIIPAASRLEFGLRAPTLAQMQKLRSRLEMCINGAAMATGCRVNYQFNDSTCYQSLITNQVLINLYKEYFIKSGMTFNDEIEMQISSSSDMGNVSHVVPAIHPIFRIPAENVNHTKEFAEAAGSLTAQKPTLAAAKAMAMTAVSLFRNQELMEEVKFQFKVDILKECSNI